MTFLQNYLNNPKVKKTLSLRYGEEGFSLIELVVVVAVLAVLSAVAIPQFTNISEKARAAAGATTVATLAKECAAKIADQGAGTYSPPTSLSGYKDDPGGWYYDGDMTNATPNPGTRSEVDNTSPTTAALGIPDGVCQDEGSFGLQSEDEEKYPSFYYDVQSGAKICVATDNAIARGCPDGSW